MSSLETAIPPFFDEELISLVDPVAIPEHIAIIMDGNRRWAKGYGMPTWVGHWRGAQALRDVCRAASHLGVKVLTTYAFSTENWCRSEAEISMIMKIFERYLTSERKRMIDEGIRLFHIGDSSMLSPRLQDLIAETEELTAKGDALDLVIGINYGGRNDIKRAMVALANKVENGTLQPEQISEEMIAQELDTARWSDPDLLIRTSGEMRISNFLLYQVSYSELLISDKLWPKFGPNDLLRAVINYQGRSIRRGK